MGIGRVNDYGIQAQNYKIPSIPSVSEEEVRKQDAAGEGAADNIHEEAYAVRPRKDAPLDDISVTFNRQDDFGYIGRDKDIESLDIDRAISDMKKDQILQQYQYFVGSARNL